MKFLLLCFLLIGCALAYPRSYYPRSRYQYPARYQPGLVRARRAPVRTMLISGFYRPVYAQRRNGYGPESAMAAFATGDNVAASSYLGSKFTPNNCLSCPPAADQNSEFIGNPEALAPQSEYEQPQFGDLPLEQPAPEVQNQPEEVGDEIPTSEVVPARVPKQKNNKKAKPQVDDDDEEDEVVNYRKGGFQSIFPIVFGGGHPGFRSGNGSGGSGGGVTAIANSYSTGKGGVATSHATAYGSGAPSRNNKKRNQTPQPVDEEDEE